MHKGNSEMIHGLVPATHSPFRDAPTAAEEEEAAGIPEEFFKGPDSAPTVDEDEEDGAKPRSRC